MSGRLFLIFAVLLPVLAANAARLKDITTVEGCRDNQLVGYGLVVGLSGSGDSKISYTTQSVSNYLKRFGIAVTPDSIKPQNIAAVMLTASIGPFAKPGSKLDVTISSIGDAKTLQGGVLLQTPLVGADDLVYAVAQGPVAIGGFLGGSGGNTVQQNHPTVAMIAGGAIVERGIDTKFVKDNSINLLLMDPDSASAARVADALNGVFKGSAYSPDPSVINVRLPADYQSYPVNFLAAIGELDVEPDMPARVIINERTGTIVATSTVRLAPVAISHGALTITISQSREASQPESLSEGKTAIVTNTSTSVKEVKGGFQNIAGAPSLDRLTSALNSLGVSTREMMSILQALKRSGALQAELIVD
jgi:flagellar P-ring protein precursor FlgI